MNDGQLEMSFANARCCRSGDRRQRRLNRARWWFERMRQVVDCASEPVTRTPRSTSLGERQLCE